MKLPDSVFCVVISALDASLIDYCRALSSVVDSDDREYCQAKIIDLRLAIKLLNAEQFK